MKKPKLKITLSALLVSCSLFSAAHAQEWNFEDQNNLAQGEVNLKNEKNTNVKLTAGDSLTTTNVVFNKSTKSGLRSVFSPLAGISIKTEQLSLKTYDFGGLSRCAGGGTITYNSSARVLDDGTPQVRITSTHKGHTFDSGWVTGIKASITNPYINDKSVCRLTTTELTCTAKTVQCKTSGYGKESVSRTFPSEKAMNKIWPL